MLYVKELEKELEKNATPRMKCVFLMMHDAPQTRLFGLAVCPFAIHAFMLYLPTPVSPSINALRSAVCACLLIV